MAKGNNLQSFELALDNFLDVEMEDLARRRVTALALEAMKGVMQLTPVDTGRAKGNWQLTLGAWPGASFEEEKKDESKEGTAPRAGPVVLEGMQDWAPGRFIWIHNGVPYITFLENGTEKIAAVHMLVRTVERLKRTLNV